MPNKPIKPMIMPVNIAGKYNATTTGDTTLGTSTVAVKFSVLLPLHSEVKRHPGGYYECHH